MEKYKGYEGGKTYLVSNEKDDKRAANKIFKNEAGKDSDAGWLCTE